MLNKYDTIRANLWGKLASCDTIKDLLKEFPDLERVALPNIKSRDANPTATLSAILPSAAFLEIWPAPDSCDPKAVRWL